MLYLESLKRRCKILTDTFNSLTGVSCVQATGAMYLFPKFEFPEKMIQAAKEKGMEADTFYALELLNNTGVVRYNDSKYNIIIIYISFLVYGTRKWILSGTWNLALADDFFTI